MPHQWEKGSKPSFISIDTEKTVDKLHQSMIKVLNKVGLLFFLIFYFKNTTDKHCHVRNSCHRVCRVWGEAVLAFILREVAGGRPQDCLQESPCSIPPAPAPERCDWGNFSSSWKVPWKQSRAIPLCHGFCPPPSRMRSWQHGSLILDFLVWPAAQASLGLMSLGIT